MEQRLGEQRTDLANFSSQIWFNIVGEMEWHKLCAPLIFCLVNKV